ncbi:Beta-xylanase [Hyella patelloides LEGE 07179]|uniref:Beta-xylanase n=1 Tax=Hyella patelloides LEGE 07179 TaxID=945734 RepID=A0A563VYS5_9CYAN|nr:endo-1,4-beta-xylanase [Hyella patelloides]VEP16413.1 Beta-xylanase [Hyella patelloides LEGE 07179]
MFPKKILTRRQALYLGLGTLAGLSTCTKSQWSNEENSTFQTFDESAEIDPIAIGETSLKERAAAKGLIYGAAARNVELKNNQFSASVIQECGMMVPKWEFRWNWLNPSPDNFNFSQTDLMVKWAMTQGMLLRGHTLIYHQSMPKWFRERVNRQNVEQIFLQYIQKVVGHYAGQIHSWDVANETIFPPDEDPNNLRKTKWAKWLGLDYFDLVFHAAAAADPQALLVLNEDWINPDTDEGEAKRVAVLKLLEKLKSQEIPIDALGMQSHIWAKDQAPLNQKKIRTFVSEVAQLGLKIIITELDVNDRHLPKDILVRDRLVAQAYSDYLSAVLDEPAVIAVNTWGLSDRYTWLAHPKRGARDDGASTRPLPLDEQFNRKLAWYAMANAFDNAPNR